MPDEGESGRRDNGLLRHSGALLQATERVDMTASTIVAFILATSAVFIGLSAGGLLIVGGEWLLSDEERKNSWTLSERAGRGTPDDMQRQLSITDWDPDAARDDPCPKLGPNRERCARAGIPNGREFATKPVPAADMIDRALDAGIRARWATGDAVYGQHSALRRRLEARCLHYVLAVPMNQNVIAPPPGRANNGGRTNSSLRCAALPDGPNRRGPGPRATADTPGRGPTSTDPPKPGTLTAGPP